MRETRKSREGCRGRGSAGDHIHRHCRARHLPRRCLLKWAARSWGRPHWGCLCTKGKKWPQSEGSWEEDTPREGEAESFHIEED